MNDEADQPRDDSGAPPPHSRGDGADLVGAALDYLRRGVSADLGAFGTPTLARQKTDLCQWAESHGRILTIDVLPAKTIRGGQEHNLFHDAALDRYVKVTRHGVFGLSPGIELALVSSSQDARRFHLWEASPLEYFDHLGIFDAHDKNLVRAGGLLVPFDVIPCRPAGGFLKFIEDTLAAGHSLRAVRTVTTEGGAA